MIKISRVPVLLFISHVSFYSNAVDMEVFVIKGGIILDFGYSKLQSLLYYIPFILETARLLAALIRPNHLVN